MSIKIENTEVFGWKMAIAGCRNPMNSRAKSDTLWLDTEYGDYQTIEGNQGPFHHFNNTKMMKEYNVDDFLLSGMYIGPADHKLLMNLCKGGTEEAKWRRMVHVQMDVTAPLYWWKEFETYKVGTVSNSCSTMHKIQAKEFTPDDFSCEHLFKHPSFEEIPNFENDEDLKAYKEQKNKALESMHEGIEYKWPERVDSAAVREVKWHYENGAYEATVEYDPYATSDDVDEWAEAKYALDVLEVAIEALNYYREKFLETKDKKYWWQMIQLLPTSYNQKRTIDLNYEVLAAQYRQRKDHKLNCWHQYCDWIKTLPYSEFITMEEKS